MNNNKTINIFLVILIIAIVLQRYGSSFLLPLLYFDFTEEQYATYSMFQKIIIFTNVFIEYVAYLIVGIILIFLSIKKKKNPFLWFLTGFSFGIPALLLFYLIEIFNFLTKKAEN